MANVDPKEAIETYLDGFAASKSSMVEGYLRPYLPELGAGLIEYLDKQCDLEIVPKARKPDTRLEPTRK